MATYVIYSNSQDGEVYCSNATYSTARSGGGTLASRTTYSLIGQYLFSGSYYVHETFLSFDTSSVAGLPITSVVLSVKDRQNVTTQDFTVNARAVDWGATLTTADFVAGASLSGNTLRASFATSGISGTGYLDFTSESTFKDNLTSPVRLLLSSSRTEAGNTPTVDEYWSIWPADASGTTDDPKLTIVATTVSASDTASLTEGTAAASVQVSQNPARDEFTGTAGDDLNTRASDSGHNWQLVSGATTMELDGSGYARVSAATAGSYHSNLLTYTPPSADYTVSADLCLLTGNVGDLTGFLARSNDTVSGSGSFLHPYLYHDSGGVYLGLYDGGTTHFYATVASVLGSYSAGTTYTVTLRMVGTAVTLLISGVVAWSGTISGPLTAGKIGVRAAATSAADATVGRISLTIDSVAETITVSEGSPSVTDPSNTAKSASDTATVTDALSSTLAKIDPSPTTTGGARSNSGSAANISSGKGGYFASYPWNGFGGGTRCPNGDILAVTAVGPSEMSGPDYTEFLRSTDQGTTWTRQARVGFDDNLAEFWVRSFTDTSGSFMLISGNRNVSGPSGADPGSYPYSDVNWYQQGRTAISTDDGATWGTSRIFSITGRPLYGRDGSGDNDQQMTGGYEILSDGSIIAPVSIVPNGDLSKTNMYQILVRSTDRGATWVEYGGQPFAFNANRQYAEASLVWLADGRLACIARTKEYPITTADDYTMWISYSSDNGLTWSGQTRMFRRCASRPLEVVGPEGDLIVGYRTVTAGQASSYTAWRQSWDHGQTWSSETSMGVGYMNIYGQGVRVSDTAGQNGNVGFVFFEQSGGAAAYYLELTAPAGYTQGRGVETATVSDSAGVTVGVGAITKTASDGFNVTDTSGGVAVTFRKTATEAITVSDSSGSSTAPTPTSITHNTRTVAATGGPTVSSTTNQVTVAEISDTSPIPA